MNDHLSLSISLPKMDPCVLPDVEPSENHFPKKNDDFNSPRPIPTSFKLKKLKYLPKKDFTNKNKNRSKLSAHYLLPTIQNKNLDAIDFQGNHSERTQKSCKVGALKHSIQPNILNQLIKILQDDSEDQTNHSKTSNKIKTERSYENQFLSPPEKQSLTISRIKEKKIGHSLFKRKILSIDKERSKNSFSVGKNKKYTQAEANIEITFYKPKKKRTDTYFIRNSLPELMDQKQFVNL